ncbi:hypothetical protein VDP25_14590 [Winogradskyella sp. ECml5-4]|uniref:hypothetical protein n=1 Tax=Winogradskyella sp. ECml5-4 TaxID=3110975 RepID=UPI002FF3AB87
MKFEKILGKEDSETLTSIVTEFENGFLKTNYPNLNIKKAYAEFLIDIESKRKLNWAKPTEIQLKKFNQSNLKNVVYGIPDSIWIVDNQKKTRTEYRVRRKYLNTKGEYKIRTLEATIPKINNNDSLITTLENYYDINYFGKYREALNTASKKNKFVQKYIEKTQEVGTLNIRLIAEKMTSANLDFDDYFTKRLIITEIVYRL